MSSLYFSHLPFSHLSLSEDFSRHSFIHTLAIPHLHTLISKPIYYQVRARRWITWFSKTPLAQGNRRDQELRLKHRRFGTYTSNESPQSVVWSTNLHRSPGTQSQSRRVKYGMTCSGRSKKRFLLVMGSRFRRDRPRMVGHAGKTWWHRK